MTDSGPDVDEVAALYGSLRTEMARVLIGKTDVVEQLTVALLTRGHVLLEGVPGVAKTTVANLFARASGLDYNRIQMTPDVLPADITGTHVYREATGEFNLQRGPVFANVVVADEINRATPKTQSALLEAMQESHVTIEGETLELPSPFIVIATQNPIELEGTFQLPEAQRDRFQLKIPVSLPTRSEEHELLDRFDREPTLSAETIGQVIDRQQLTDARAEVGEVYVDDSVKEYILDIVAATREHPDVEHGGSPRAALAFLNTGKARAAISGREYVIPDDVKAMAEAVLRHRLILSTDAELSDVDVESVVERVLSSVDVPSSAYDDSDAAAVGDGGENLGR